MKKFKIEKVSIAALLNAFIGLFASIVAIVLCVVDSNDPITGLSATIAMCSLAGFVIMIAGLSTKKARLVRTFTIIMLILVVVASFVISIVEFSRLSQAPTKNWDLIGLLTIALCLFVDAILFLVYYLNKNDELANLRKTTNILLIAFVVILLGFEIAVQVFGDLYASMRPSLIADIVLLLLVVIMPFTTDPIIVVEEVDRRRRREESAPKKDEDVVEVKVEPTEEK